MFIDVHCHIDDTTYGDVGALIEKCRDRGVGRIICVGFDLPSSVYSKELAEKYDQVYFTAGFHPTELKDYKEGDLHKIKELCMHEKCVALGEIGLDYHYEDTDRQKQRDIFVRQLGLAAELGLPVEIHSRDCAEDMLNILKDNRQLIKGGALMHCYSHSVEIAEELVKLGLYFSFGGASTWKGSKRAKRVIVMLPAERILTETDSPYMPPQSLYGTFPNTPQSIPEIAANIAAIKGIDEEQFEMQAYENALRLFSKLR